MKLLLLIGLMILLASMVSTASAETTIAQTCETKTYWAAAYYGRRRVNPLKGVLKSLNKSHQNNDYSQPPTGDATTDTFNGLINAFLSKARQPPAYLNSMITMIYKLPDKMYDKAVTKAAYQHCLDYHRPREADDHSPQ